MSFQIDVSPIETHLLRACLLTGPQCEAAWRAFTQIAQDPRRYLTASDSDTKALLAQLFASLQNAGVEVEPEIGTYLKMAYVWEEARHETYSRVNQKLLSVLNSAKLRYLVISGSVVGSRFYEPAFLRHNYGIDLMVAPENLAQARAAAADAGFEPDSNIPTVLHGALSQHSSGIPLYFHTRYAPMVGPDCLLEQVWHRSICAEVSRCAVRTLSDADTLFAICSRLLFAKGSAALLLVCDAARILARRQDLSWPVFLTCTAVFGMSAEMREVLHYLCKQVQARVPDGVLELLAASGSTKSKAADTESASPAIVQDEASPIVKQAEYVIPDARDLSFAIGGEGTALTSCGWAAPEATGRWTLGHIAQLAFRIPDSCGRRLLLSFLLRPFAHPSLVVDVFVNGSPVDHWEYQRDALFEHRIVIDNILLEEGLVRVEFRINNPSVPARVGVSSDTRSLGIHVQHCSIQWLGLPVRDARRYRSEFPSVVPSCEQELLLKAGLLPGDCAARAWNEWRVRGDLDPFSSAYWGLFPLVFANRKAACIAAADIPILKSAYYITWERNVRRTRALAELVLALKGVGIEVIILKGMALIGDYGGDLGLRPMNDIDILVRSHQRDHAISTLAQLEFKPLGGPYSKTEWQKLVREEHAWSFHSEKYDLIDLHWHVLHGSCQTDADEEFWSSSERTKILASLFSRLNATDRLLHTCAHGMRWDISGTTRWVADAAMIVKAHGSTIDWSRFVRQARRHRLTATVHRSMEYLSTFLPTIPEETLRELVDTRITLTEELTHYFLARLSMDNSAAIRFALSYETSLAHQPSLRQATRWRALKSSVRRHRKIFSGLAQVVAFWPLTLNGRISGRLGRIYYDRTWRRNFPARYRLGSTIRFSAHRNGWIYMREGWNWPAIGGTWSEGSVARLLLRSQVPCRSDYVMEITGRAHVHTKYPVLSVDVGVNGTTVGTMEFCHEGRRTFVFALPASMLANERLEIVFQIYNPSSPKTCGISEDIRSLGIFLSKLRIMRSPRPLPRRAMQWFFRSF
jgi:hypothetical protein